MHVCRSSIISSIRVSSRQCYLTKTDKFVNLPLLTITVQHCLNTSDMDGMPLQESSCGP